MAYPLTGTARSSAGVTINRQTQVTTSVTRVWSPFLPYARSSGVTLWPPIDLWPASGQGWPRIKQL